MQTNLETSDEIQPVVRTIHHPVERDSAVLPTRPLEDFVNEINEWLDSRITGGIVWGYNRVGKSQAIKYLNASGSQVFFGSSIPMGIHSTSDPKKTSLTERRFFGEILHSLGFVSPDSGTAEVKRRRLIELIAGRVESAGDFRFVLFIDEAQWLAEVQLRYLMDIHNQLKLMNIRLVCVLVGQPDLIDIKSNLRAAKKNHLLGRFMMVSHKFDGICSQSDLMRVFNAFDCQSEFPAGTSCSFTAYYVPIAFDSGWRLKDNTGLVWNTFNRVLEIEQLPKCSEYPMQAYMDLIVWILKSLRKEDSTSLQLTQAIIEEGIYRNALTQIQDHIAQVSPN